MSVEREWLERAKAQKVEIDASEIRFFEKLRMTTVGALKVGDRVQLLGAGNCDPFEGRVGVVEAKVMGGDGETLLYRVWIADCSKYWATRRMLRALEDA